MLAWTFYSAKAKCSEELRVLTHPLYKQSTLCPPESNRDSISVPHHYSFIPNAVMLTLPCKDGSWSTKRKSLLLSSHSETCKTTTYFCQHLNYILPAQRSVPVWRFQRAMAPQLWGAMVGSCDTQAVWPWAPVCGMMKTLVLLSPQWSISPCGVRFDINRCHKKKIRRAINWHKSCRKNAASSLYEWAQTGFAMLLSFSQ